MQPATNLLLLQQWELEVSLCLENTSLLHISILATHLSYQQKGQLPMQVRRFLQETVGKINTCYFIPSASTEFIRTP